MDFGRWVMGLRTPRRSVLLVSVLGLVTALCTQGCHDDMPVPAVGQIEEFTDAGPTGPAVDTTKLVKARLHTGPHRVVPGEVLELTMPAILRVVTAGQTGQAEGMGETPFVCRVSPMGTIVLPVVGEMPVSGRTLAEIESGVANAYYPTYAKTYPSVFARVIEYKTHRVSITGAVQKPGIYDLRTDQLSLVALIMEAGGIIDDGAGLIRIVRTQAAEGTPDTGQPRRPSPSQPGSAGAPDPDIRLSFSPHSPAGTSGTLQVSRRGQVLANADLDLASPVQRRRVLTQVSSTNPGVSTDYLDRQLASLGAMIGSTGRTGEHSATLASATVADQAPDAGPRRTTSVAEGLARVAMLDAEPLLGRGFNGPDADLAQGGAQTLILPVKGVSIPFEDVALREGDSVEIDRLVPAAFTVLGLVKAPGTFPYPPDATYNLMQAIGLAGGTDLAASPRYAMIYRLKRDGDIACMPFEIANPEKKGEILQAMHTVIKPGDVVAIEHTPRTRTNAFMDKVFHVTIGGYIPLFR